MKKVAFILYVGCVLAFSAFARAEVAMPFSKQSNLTTPIQIENVLIDKNNLDLQIDGFLPNPCTQVPSASLVQDIENPAVLVLSMTSPLHNEICVSRTIEYRTVVNLPVIAQNSQLNLDPRATYVVKAAGASFEIQVQGVELMRVPGFIAN